MRDLIECHNCKMTGLMSADGWKLHLTDKAGREFNKTFCDECSYYYNEGDPKFKWMKNRYQKEDKASGQ